MDAPYRIKKGVSLIFRNTSCFQAQHLAGYG